MERTCHHCGKPLPEGSDYRKKYCDAYCKDAAYQARKRERREKNRECIRCGKPLEPGYSNKNCLECIAEINQRREVVE